MLLLDPMKARILTEMSLRRFVGMRLVRLYPMLAVSLMIAMTLGEPTTYVALGLLFIPSFITIALFPANGPQWSLFLELVGNFAHAAGFRLLSTRNIVAIVIASGTLTAFAAFHFGNLEVGSGLESLWGGVVLFVFTYMMGVLIFRLEDAGIISPKQVPLSALFMAYILFAGCPQPKHGLLSAARDFLCSAMIFPIIIAYAPRAFAPDWLNRVSKLGGDISYPLYIIHHPIVVAIGGVVLLQQWSDIQLKAFGVLVVAFCAVLAYGILKLVDEPVRVFLSKRLLSRPLVEYATP